MAAELITDRLILRALTIEDASELFAIRSLEDVHKQL
jgi:hypothetical protein